MTAVAVDFVVAAVAVNFVVAADAVDFVVADVADSVTISIAVVLLLLL